MRIRTYQDWQRLLGQGAVVMGLGTLAACTSSNSATNINSNSSYDSGYASQLRSPQQLGGSEPKAQATEPVYTIMALGSEVGEIHPGEDYAIFCVADNPDLRGKLEYVWSCSNGAISELPEADRGRIQTIIEQEDVAIRSGAYNQPSDAPAGPPPAEAPPAATPADGSKPETPAAATGSASTGQPNTAQPVNVPQPPAPAQPKVYTVNDLPENQRNAPENIRNLFLRQMNGEALTADETQALLQFQGVTPINPSAATSSLQRRFVGAPESVLAGPKGKPQEASEAEELAARALEAAREELDRFRATPAGAANVADQPAGGDGASLHFEASERLRERSLRDEYEHWGSDESEVRRRNLGGAEEDESEALEAEASYEMVSFTTNEPYILWTPSRPGVCKLYCKLVWKENDLTDPQHLEIDVTLREPIVEISEEFPDVIREDENVLIRLDAENLPDFKKGLFTLEYDPDVLSFRTAELGEFFDDARAASVYFAEPDRLAGRALLAIDSNTELAELSGDGPLAYVKFKAKRDIRNQSETKLAMVTDTSARYILNRDGENILPVPIEKSPLRSTITVPPVQAGTIRETPPEGSTAAGGAAPLGTGAAAAGAAAGTGPAQVPQTGGQANTGTGPVLQQSTTTQQTQTQTRVKGASSQTEADEKPVAPLADAGEAGDDTQMIGPMPPGTPPAAGEDVDVDPDKPDDADEGLKGKSN